MNNSTKSKKHWHILIIACLMCSASIGFVLNTIGLFYVPVATDLNLLVGEFAFHSTLNSLAMAFMSLSFPYISKKIGFKKTIVLGITLAFIGTAFMGLTNKLWGFYLLGIIRGAGAGLFERVPMTILINNWFEEKNGLALSIANSTAGIVGAIFAPIITWFIEFQGWEIAFLWVGIFILLFSLPVIFYPFSVKPEDAGYLPYGYKEQKPDVDGNLSLHTTNNKKFSYKSLAFLALIIFAFLQATLVGMATHMTAIGESFGLTLQTAGIMTSALMIGNIVFKLLYGVLSDKIGSIKTTTFTILTNIIGVILLIISNNPLILSVGAFLFGSVYAIASVTFPVLLKEAYGRVVSNRVFPLLNFVINIGKALAISVVGFAFDFTGSYMIVLVIALAFNFIDLIALYIIYNSSN